MTAPLCKDCAYVRYGKDADDVEQRCGIMRLFRPRTSDKRIEGGSCGPDGKLFAKRQGVA